MSKSNGKTQPTPDTTHKPDRFEMVTASLTPEFLGVQPEFVEVLLEEAQSLIARQVPVSLKEFFEDFAWIYYVLYESAKGSTTLYDTIADFTECVGRLTIHIWKHGGEFGNSAVTAESPYKTAD
ncbi:hypothetical protein ATHL_00757 [Anaerolinea thermolimosa]|uniref:hypothetical protein n=1 Tax=Anaerolinea thermolimosa TaxID=229919 RepID=UPI000780A79E|nr:hypothetical protein [Anaerolinea thermolimosa]GAP05916.1 hypothetical protein ATHL_00757 [Anaerolinea thermolimosa]